MIFFRSLANELIATSGLQYMQNLLVSFFQIPLYFAFKMLQNLLAKQKNCNVLQIVESDVLLHVCSIFRATIHTHIF